MRFHFAKLPKKGQATLLPTEHGGLLSNVNQVNTVPSQGRAGLGSKGGLRDSLLPRFTQERPGG